jgi:putative transcriptional regulator
MTQANEPQTTQSAQIRSGLLDRLKLNSGIKSDEAFARMIGVSRATLGRLKAGEEPTLRTVVGIAQAFGLALGEVVEITTEADTLAVAS